MSSHQGEPAVPAGGEEITEGFCGDWVNHSQSGCQATRAKSEACILIAGATGLPLLFPGTPEYSLNIPTSPPPAPALESLNSITVKCQDHSGKKPPTLCGIKVCKENKCSGDHVVPGPTCCQGPSVRALWGPSVKPIFLPLSSSATEINPHHTSARLTDRAAARNV